MIQIGYEGLKEAQTNQQKNNYWNIVNTISANLERKILNEQF